MKLRPKITIADHFNELEDPRIERTKRHKLIDIITISICAVICGAEGWNELELYGKCKYKWLKKFLELPNGIPSHDTFGRVFSLLNPEQLQQCFLNWIESISLITFGEIVAIDGKTLRGSYDKSKDKPAIHMVSAWGTHNGLVLGQRRVEDKSNEITAIPELLRVLSLKGAIVTIDAIGCQKKIIKQIIDQDGEYVIALKKNQNGLYDRVEKLFNEALLNDFQGLSKSEYRRSEDEHGRSEIRYCQILTKINQSIDPQGEWKNLNSIAYLDYLRTEKGKTTLEKRYFISSLNAENHQAIAIAIRKHWCIENQLHWGGTDGEPASPYGVPFLDVSFNEDASRIRKDNAPENLAIIRQIALNLLKQEKTLKVGVKNKRKNAGWDDKYLIKVLTS